MEPEEEKIETPVEAPAEVPVEEPVEASSESEADAVEAAAPEEERKPTPMPKPKEPKIPLPSSLQEIVGALLFASQTPLTITDLRQSIRGVEPAEGDNVEVMGVYQSCTTREVEQAVHGLEKELERAGCGFRLVCAGGAYRLQTAPTCGRYVRALLKLDRPNRLSRASLETLAIVAYRQPITKSEIEDIRGVDVSANIKTLMDLQLIRLVGKSELPGHPFLYGTTALFLDHFGLASLQQLNELDPTLQRSNPKKKAEQYRRPEKLELEVAAKDAAAESAASSAGEAKTAEVAEEASQEGAAAPDADELPLEGSAQGGDDDDFFIDDTPDEFDDDDDDDEDEEEEDEDETESEGSDDADGADGADRV